VPILKLSTRQLSEILHLPIIATYRLATILKFERTMGKKNRLVWSFDADHPLVKSIDLIRVSQTKPIYTIRELSHLWLWRGNPYSTERVRQKLDNADIPIQNKSRKGFVYLCHLQKLIKE
jgi:hypothetical protein